MASTEVAIEKPEESKPAPASEAERQALAEKLATAIATLKSFVDLLNDSAQVHAPLPNRGFEASDRRLHQFLLEFQSAARAAHTAGMNVEEVKDYRWAANYWSWSKKQQIRETLRARRIPRDPAMEIWLQTGRNIIEEAKRPAPKPQPSMFQDGFDF